MKNGLNAANTAFEALVASFKPNALSVRFEQKTTMTGDDQCAKST